MPPLALAVALDTLSDAPDAAKLADPPDDTLVDVVAVTLSLTSASASAAPTAAEPPAAVPLASVDPVDVCDAVTATEPDAESPPASAPIDACVSSSIRDSATTGVTATPPAEPWSACVVAPCAAKADRLTAPAPASDDPSKSSASDRVATMLSATDAPTPTLLPTAPIPDGSADTLELVASSLKTATDPSPAAAVVAPETGLTVTVPDAISPTLSLSIRSSPSDPATPTLEAPAPDVADASNRSSRSSSPAPPGPATSTDAGPGAVEPAIPGDATPRSLCSALTVTEPAP